MPVDEQLRLQELYSLELLGSAPDAAFDALVALAQQLLDVPIAAISLIDRHRQWFKARIGLTLDETPREVAFCAHTIGQDEPFVVEDALRDARFASNPLVLGAPHVRFYAGAPLHGPTGAPIGTLCVIDQTPKHLSAAKRNQLRALSLVADQLVQNRARAIEARDLFARLELKNETITAHKQVVAKQARILEYASSHARLGAWERDLATGELVWSAGMYAMHDLPPGSRVSLEDMLDMYLPADRERLVAGLREAERTGAPMHFEGRMTTPAGRLAWVRVVSETEFVDGRPVRRFGMKQDITEQKTLLESLTRLAERDDLTGLYNRRELRRRLDDAFELPDCAITLVLFDLDGFKDINDTFGHDAGDACLRKIAARLRASLEDEEIVLARTGGDEFAVLLLDRAADQIEAVSSEIASCVGSAVSWRELKLSISCSIGFSSRSAATTAEQLMRQADLALYDCKASGRNGSKGFNPALQETQNAKIRVIQEVREAIAEGRMELFYQTKVDLRDERHLGYEALLRMRRRDGSVAAPGEFMAALEDPALSAAIGDVVLDAATSQAADWHRRGVPFVSIAVNLTAVQILDLQFPGRLAALVRERGLHPDMIALEITEGILLSTTHNALTVCSELKALGFSIAFDDFGTGFASLTHLRDYPIDALKIDRSFIRELTTGGSSTSIVNAMVGLGINLSLTVVAEGIETEAEYEFLRAIGCTAGQGYYFGRPVEAAEAELRLGDEQQRLSALQFA